MKKTILLTADQMAALTADGSVEIASAPWIKAAEIGYAKGQYGVDTVGVDVLPANYPGLMGGPLRLTELRCGPWRVVAEEVRRPCGGTTWDVYLAHDSGVRVPQGPNFHAAPAAELGRLERSLDWPRAR